MLVNWVAHVSYAYVKFFFHTDEMAENRGITERSVRRRRVRPQQDAEQHIKLKTDKAGLRAFYQLAERLVLTFLSVFTCFK